VASGPLTGLLFMVYYSDQTGYVLIDFHELSNGPSYSLESEFGIDPNNPDPNYTNEYFEIWYLNSNLDDEALDPSQLYKVYGPYTNNLPVGFFIEFDAFDVSDVVLGAPGGYARALGTADAEIEFSWQPRFTGEYYQICIYDPLILDATTSDPDDPIILCSTAFNSDGTLAAAAQNKVNFIANVTSFPADYPFAYNQPYYWFVRNYEPSTIGVPFASGTSFYENTIIFLDQPDAPPPPVEDAGGSIGTSTAKPWTVLVYMAADNELGDTTRVPNPESNIKRQWENLKSIAPNYAANITVVTYTDFYNDGSTQICNVSVNPAQCEELGEQNSADPAQLQGFVTKARAAYPAENSMLVFATHGHGVVGIGFDQSITDDGAVMTPNQVRTALTNAGVGSNKFDIIFYNACLMATLETAADTAPFADYMVASTNRLWVVNIYQELLDGIAAQSANPAEVAKGIVTAYTNRVAAKVPGGVYSNMTAFDLSKAAAVVEAVSNLGTALDGALAASRPVIDTARKNAQVYDSSGNNLLDAYYDSNGDLVAREEDAFIDVRHFAQLVVAGGPAGAVAAANQVVATVDAGFIIAGTQKAGPNKLGADAQTFDMTNASGIGMYFPNGSSAGRQATYNEAYLFGLNYQTYNAGSQWDDFLRNYTGNSVSQAPGSVGRRGEPVAGNTSFGVVYVPMARK
jgi:hypothetical protein